MPAGQRRATTPRKASKKASISASEMAVDNAPTKLDAVMIPLVEQPQEHLLPQGGVFRGYVSVVDNRAGGEVDAEKGA